MSTFHPRYFARAKRDGRTLELKRAPLKVEMHALEFFEVLYDAGSVENAFTHYRALCDQIEKSASQLPDFFVKFYFDLKRRIEHEHQLSKPKVQASKISP